MALILGTSGNDNDDGTSNSDIFDYRQSGDDTARGHEGDDVFLFGGFFNGLDSVDGGDDTDKVVLRGDYSSGITLGATTLTGVEKIQFTKGNDYSVTTHDGNVAGGDTLFVNARSLLAGDDLTFDGSAETNGRFRFFAGAGDDALTGGTGRDVFHLEMGGADSADGGFGIDTFYMDASLDAADSIDGGFGHKDRMYLDGDYAGANALVCTPTTFVHIENIILAAGHSYDLTPARENVTNSYLTIDGSALGATDSLSVDLGNVDSQFVQVLGAAGDDTVTAGSGGVRYVPGMGSDVFLGGSGLDVVAFTEDGTFDATDSFDGGAGPSDTFFLKGHYYGTGLTITGSMMSNFEQLFLQVGYYYNITLTDDVVAAGESLYVFSQVVFGEFARFDGSTETDGRFEMYGSAGDDTWAGGALADGMSGGAGINSLKGNGGADDISCNNGTDTVVYSAASQSNSSAMDIVRTFNFDVDKFDTEVSVTSTATATGDISAASFDTDMGNILSDFLVAIVTATGGDLIGHSYLVVSADGDFGYDAGLDYVMELVGFTGTLDTGDFI